MTFTAYFDRRWNTIDGVFTIQDSNGHKVFDRILARSGQRGWTDTSWHPAKSPCPYGRFNLNLVPNNRGQDAGETGIGEFFPMDNQGDRYTIRSMNGQYIRREIGLHEENKWPGSAGCIVIVKSIDWDAISHWLKERSKTQKIIPIEVL